MNYRVIVHHDDVVLNGVVVVVVVVVVFIGKEKVAEFDCWAGIRDDDGCVCGSRYWWGRARRKRYLRAMKDKDLVRRDALGPKRFDNRTDEFAAPFCSCEREDILVVMCEILFIKRR